MNPDLLEHLERVLEELFVKEKMVELLNDEIFSLQERKEKILAELEKALMEGKEEPHKKKIQVGRVYLLIPHRLASGKYMIELRRSSE